MLARRSNIDVNYQGINITAELTKNLKGFSYTDNATGEADNISIQLEDVSGKWINEWYPSKGDKIQSIIKTTNWRFESDQQILNCGIFLVDDIASSGRPRETTIGAISIPADSDFTSTNKSKTWKNSNIKNIVLGVANDSNLFLVYDTSYNPTLKFVEQSETPDISFLYELCQKNGLAIKTYSDKIIIFLESEYEQKPSLKTIDETDMKSWSTRTSLTDTAFDGCRVKYKNPKTGKLISYTFKDPAKSGNKIFEINDIVYSFAEAERLAKSTLRNLNKGEYIINFSIIGDLELYASNNINVTGLGRFNGKYYIDKVTHSLGGGFESQIECHRVLEGY